MKKNLLAAVLVFGFGSSALAADTGTVTVKGTVDPMFSIQFDSASAGAPSGNAAGTALSYTLDFSDLLNNPLNTTIQTEQVSFALRSNAAYGLYAVREDGAAAVNTSDVTPADIGFQIKSVDSTGSLVVPSRAAEVSTFLGTNDSVALNADGTVTFPTSLNSLNAGTTSTATSAATKVLSGDRISNKGGFNNPNNAIIVESEFAMLPQFFQAGSFEYTVHFTVAAP